jgi:hypothetical protein
LAGVTLPHAETDSILAALAVYATNDQQRQTLARWTGTARDFEGRPAAAAEILRSVSDSIALDLARLESAEFDSAATARVSGLVGTRFRDNTTQACNIALARLRWSDTSGVTAILAALPVWKPGAAATEFTSVSADVRRLSPPGRGQVQAQRSAMVCREVLAGVLAAREPGGLAMLSRADSIMRIMPLIGSDYWNYDLGLAFARRGAYAAAAAAARRRWLTPATVPRLVITLRQEGRWSALAGDTASAIKAYRHYLLWRDAPEPILVPQRDSVRAELAALERGTRRRATPRP